MELKSKWKVSSNPVGGKTLYQVYRIRDLNEVNHSGNRENAGELTENKDEAQLAADLLNAEGADNREG